jgi:hypothetical protein
MKTFTEECAELINQFPTSSGTTAKLIHRLYIACCRLDVLTEQADAQFAAGDTHATFNKSIINAVKEPLCHASKRE